MQVELAEYVVRDGVLSERKLWRGDTKFRSLITSFKSFVKVLHDVALIVKFSVSTLTGKGSS